MVPVKRYLYCPNHACLILVLNTGRMNELNLLQLQHESETWNRSLNMMNDEIIRFKTRLSEVLRTGFDNSLLNDLEHFQTRFLEADEWIIILRNELAEMNMLMIRVKHEQEQLQPKLEPFTNLMRKHIAVVQDKFNQLQSAFNVFLSASILYQ